MRSSGGLTLIEVLVALAVVAIGLIAVAGMQTTGLRGTRSATETQVMSNIAHSELQLQRVFDRHVSGAVTEETCRSGGYGEQYECRVNIYPCELSSAALDCRNTTQVKNVVAHQVVVQVQGPGNSRVEAATVVR